MYRLTKYGCVSLDETEAKKLHNLIFDKADKNYHYLAFDRQFGGYSPLNVFIMENQPEMLKEEQNVFETLLAKKEVCSLYPKLNLTLYPLIKLEGTNYELDLENIDKHFGDILELNDRVYKTKYLFVDFGHGADNFNQELILDKLRELFNKSNILEDIFIEFLAEEPKKQISIKENVVKEGQFCGDQTIGSVKLPNPIRVCSNAFKDCKSLKSVHFDFGGGDVIIESGAFDSCTNLKDIHLMLESPEVKVQIDDEAFSNTKQQIIFHVPAFKKVYEGLEEFAKKHNYKIKNHL